MQSDAQLCSVYFGLWPDESENGREVLRGLLEAAKELGGICSFVQEDSLKVVALESGEGRQALLELEWLVSHDKQGEASLHAVTQSLQ